MKVFNSLAVSACLCMLLINPATGSDDDDEPRYNQVQLSAQAHREVQADLLSVTLFRQAEGRNTQRLTKEVNEDIAWAIAQARGVPRVKVETLDYRTTPMYKKGSIDRWQVRQSIQLQSKDTAALSELTGDLQEKLKVLTMQYQLSPELLRETEDALISEALAAFHQRASRVAGQLGSDDYRLVRMNIGTASSQRPGPVPRYARMAAEVATMDAAPPSMEPGEHTVRITVSATVELERFAP